MTEESTTLKPTMLYETLDTGLVLLVHGELPPRDDEWRTYIEWAREALLKQGELKQGELKQGELKQGEFRCFVRSQGGAPTSVQRGLVKQMTEEFSTTRGVTAVVSDSPLVRGALTALLWITAGGKSAIKPFKPNEFAAAAAYVGADQKEVPLITQRVEWMLKQLVS